MATIRWFGRTTGLDANAGGSDSNTGRVTRESGTTGTVVNAAKTLTDLGATFVTSGVLVTDAVNINVGGVRTVFEIASIDSETQITLVTAPANGSYDYTIGGARTLLGNLVNTGAGKNPTLAANDTIGLKGGTYTENVVTVSTTVTVFSSDGVEAVIDGTGGGAGSDGIVCGSQNVTLVQIAVINAVDDGLTAGTVTLILNRCRFQANGDEGCALGNTIVRLNYCQFLANGGDGVSGVNAGDLVAVGCRFDGNVGVGIGQTTGPMTVAFCTFVDQGADGINYAGTGTRALALFNNTFDGNTGDGLELAATTTLMEGSSIRNNIFSNNANGVNSSGGAQTKYYSADYNVYFGNGTARVNFDTGTNDVSTDPVFTNAASDDYTIGSTGSAYRTGYSAKGGNNKEHRGAVPGPGSAEQTGDYPAAGNVRQGVSYANGTLTGTLSVAGGGGIFPQGWAG